MKALLVGLTVSSETIVARVLGDRGSTQIVVGTGADALQELRRSPAALVIVEDPLPDMTASELCRRVRASEAEHAVILVLTGAEQELAAVLDAGANDLYATSLGPAALEVRVLVAAGLVAEHARLRDRELRFRRLFESGVAGVTIADAHGKLKEANDSFLAMLGYERAQMLSGQLSWETVTPAARWADDRTARAQLASTGFLPLREREYVHRDGHHICAIVGSAALEGTGDSISYITDISAQKDAERALRASETQYRALFEEAPSPKFLHDIWTLRILEANAAAVRQYGYTREELLGLTLADLRPRDEVPALLARFCGLEAGATLQGRARHVRKDGTVFDVDETVHAFVLGNEARGLTIAVDVTERTRLERRLLQAQKMDAIGNLAGGVAHDFNNLLSVILSYSSMLASGLKAGDPMRGDLDEISRAGQRAAALTQQLLAFGRQQILEPRPLDVNAVLGGVSTMLGRLVGADVEISIVSGAGLGTVLADPGQVEQVLMNLVVNARDAMPTGGKLTIETANVVLDDAYASTRPDARPGNYVMLAVTDNGTGMDAATRDRIFEPYFTTKEKGKGTGLGLATVFGIVRQSGGFLDVYSEPGVGTTFKVYFPHASVARVEATEAVAEVPVLGGSETILLVEDEEAVRAVVRSILERSGYRVLVAHNGGDALLICEQHPAKIHVLLTDVVMPRMNGRQLAERLCVERPDMRVLYMSGYTDDAIVRHGVIDSDTDFLQKPITPDALNRKLRAVIAGPARSLAAPTHVDGR